MKRLIALLFPAVLFIVSCKKEKDCSLIAHKTPCYIAFKGFDTSEVHTLIQTSYQKGGTFSARISTDTLRFVKMGVFKDTVFAAAGRTYMCALDANMDYEITLPAVSRTFRVAGILYSSDTVLHWTSKDGCNTSQTFNLHPYNGNVDGVNTLTTRLSSNDTRWIILKK